MKRRPRYDTWIPPTERSNMTTDSKTTHTPGPWKIRVVPNPLGSSTHIRGADNTIAARVEGTNREANAHLIAAAPTMLKALEAIYAFAETASSGYGHDPDTDVAIIAGKARAAIKKAKNES